MKTNPQEVNFFETGQAPTIQNVKVGDKIRTEKEPDEDIEADTWIVRQVYPFFVYATSGSRHRCFNYGMLVQLGLEDGFDSRRRRI